MHRNDSVSSPHPLQFKFNHVLSVLHSLHGAGTVSIIIVTLLSFFILHRRIQFHTKISFLPFFSNNCHFIFPSSSSSSSSLGMGYSHTDPDSDSDPVTRYSQTERIVLLIDLDPLLHNTSDPTLYTAALLSAATTFLSFPPLSSTLFSFRLFFSSLSPLLSPLSIPLSLSFDLPSPTLHQLTKTLTSLPSFSHHHSTPKASHIANALRQLVHDYSWDHDPSSNSSPIPSNLVLFFSPLWDSFECLSRFYDAEDCNDVDSFCERFSGFFGSVRDVFGSRDIHCSWVRVSVRSESECGEIGEIGQVRGLFEIGVKGLGWGFCDADSILLGSALVPFGLIYPKIGVCWDSFDFNDCSSGKVQLQLSLQILDVNGSPIHYNCCDLEFFNSKIFPRYDGSDARFNHDLGNSHGGGFDRKDKLWKQFSDGIAKFEVKAVQKCDAFKNLGDCLSEFVIVREVFKESKKNKKGDSVEFYADRVLEMLATEFGFQWQRKSVPIWEILLSFLCKEGFWALVFLTNGSGDSCMCVMRPFTFSSAILSVLENSDMANDSRGANVAHYIRMNKVLFDSQAKKSAAANEKTMDLNTLKNLTWTSFCDSAKDNFKTDLQEVYSAVECNKLKKLKFVKCWMKQMKKSGFCDITLLEKPKENEIIAEENKGESPQDGEQPITSCASAEINTQASRTQDDGEVDYRSETSEAFFSNLSSKIQQGIESEVINLGAMAERLVNSAIYWLSQKDDKETNSESQKDDKETNSESQKDDKETNSESQKDDKETNSESQNACSGTVASKLIKLLLREPKELAAKHKSRNSFSRAFEPGTTAQVTENAVREYELQILFRMEILQSEVGSGVEDTKKQKFVKQICQLLENIPSHMEGGFFGDWSLEDYVSKIIKCRYSHTLEDVVSKIYNKMDLLPFPDNEDEAPNDLLNSEDSNKSWNKIVYRDEMGENDISNEPVSAENEPFQLQKNHSGKQYQRVNQEKHDGKLIEAKKRRERARRFSSFTSWIPDFQRVWAPKQKGFMKPKAEPFQKLPKKKERKRASYDRVCETPLTGNKRSSLLRRRGSDDENDMVDGSEVSSSVSKALFRDDD